MKFLKKGAFFVVWGILLAYAQDQSLKNLSENSSTFSTEQEYQRLESRCYGGDSWICYQMGKMYQTGVGVMSNPKKAKVLYSRACSFGILEACDALEFGKLMHEF